MSKEIVRITTPTGRAVFPWLNSADTEYSDEGVFHVSLALDPSDDGVQEFLDTLDEMATAAYDKAVKEAKPAMKKKLVRAEPYVDEVVVDEETGEESETGCVLVKCKTKAVFKSKSGDMMPRKIPFFDAQGKQLPEVPSIWGGSLLKVNVTPADYMVASTKQAGVTCRINAIQIISLQGGGGADAASYGFGAEEGDYEAPSVDNAGGTDGGDDEDF